MKLYWKQVFLIPIIIIITACSNFELPDKRLGNHVIFEGESLQGLTESEIRARIERVAKRVNESSRDAKLNEWDWSLAEKEKQGVKINIEKTVDKIFHAKKNETVKSVKEVIKPKITEAQLMKKIVKISSYASIILDKTQERMNNLKIGMEWINNEKVLPGQVFSFNEVLGKRTKSKGYKKAPVIIKTKTGAKKKDDFGGGVCQITSTLYNALKIPGIEILERHPHSKTVGYVPKGEDATVSYGYLDFKFKNARSYPLMVKVQFTKQNLEVSIYENQN